MPSPEKNQQPESQPAVEQDVATFIDTFLEGELPKKKGAYQRIRRLCAGAVERLPYKALEEAMEAIRGRGRPVATIGDMRDKSR